MKKLYELAAQNASQKRVVVALLPVKSDGPIWELYKILFSKDELVDNEAMLKIYGRRNVGAFSSLKARMEDILIRALATQNVTLNFEGTRIDEIVDGNRNVLASRILFNRRINLISIELVEDSLQKSMKYELTENVIIQARLLKHHYGIIQNSYYKYLKYSNILNIYLNIYNWEIKSETYYLELQNVLAKSVANVDLDTRKKVLEYYIELNHVSDVKTKLFLYNKFRLLLAYYELNKNLEEFLKLSYTALRELNVDGNDLNSYYLNISTRILWALVQTGRYDETIAIGKNLYIKLPIATNSWYRVAYYVLKALLYNGDYCESITFISSFLENRKFKKGIFYFKELFYLKLGYIHLLYNAGQIDCKSRIGINLPEFKLGKLLNTAPIFIKDKRGINVSFLLLQIAFLLQRRKFDFIIDKIDSLKNYVSRYLRHDETFRSNCMIKMVIQMTKANFNPVKTARYTADLRKQLGEVPLAGSGGNIEIEVIPFEVLWDIMMKAIRPEVKPSRKRS